jgi:hypothetical protein
MIKCTSSVWKRPELSDAEFRRRELGRTHRVLKAVPGVRE